MGSTNQTLAIFFPLHAFAGYEHSGNKQRWCLIYWELWWEEEAGSNGDLSREEQVLYLFYHVHICQAGYLEVCVFAWFEVIKAKAQNSAAWLNCCMPEATVWSHSVKTNSPETGKPCWYAAWKADVLVHVFRDEINALIEYFQQYASEMDEDVMLILIFEHCDACKSSGLQKSICKNKHFIWY